MFCKECGKILHGRSDKRFCNDDCRSSYHNKKRRTKKALSTEPEIPDQEEDDDDFDLICELAECLNHLIRNQLIGEQKEKDDIPPVGVVNICGKRIFLYPPNLYELEDEDGEEDEDDSYGYDDQSNQITEDDDEALPSVEELIKQLTLIWPQEI